MDKVLLIWMKMNEVYIICDIKGKYNCNNYFIAVQNKLEFQITPY